MSTLIPNSWTSLKKFTAARIALGRAGGSLPTREHLEFSMAHALARDAVHSRLNTNELERSLVPMKLGVLHVHSDAPDRMTYLVRPDLGRRLSEESTTYLAGFPVASSPYDISIVVADGLSALAAQRQAPALLAILVPMLQQAGFHLAPLVIAKNSRVALMDEVGSILHAKLAIILLGERPGLGSPDSLGAYIEYEPKLGMNDAQRNCISNIRPEGLPLPAAAETIAYLATQAIRRQLTGVNLKDDRNLMA